jgi:hypothetical protein
MTYDVIAKRGGHHLMSLLRGAQRRGNPAAALIQTLDCHASLAMTKIHLCAMTETDSSQ